jgi:hypothetical protein
MCSGVEDPVNLGVSTVKINRDQDQYFSTLRNNLRPEGLNSSRQFKNEIKSSCYKKITTGIQEFPS